jgi:hypothetical protein
MLVESSAWGFTRKGLPLLARNALGLDYLRRGAPVLDLEHNLPQLRQLVAVLLLMWSSGVNAEEFFGL